MTRVDDEQAIPGDVKDEGDVAQDYQNRLNQDGINRVLAEARRPVAMTLKICEDCGEVIPRGRRKAQPGCSRCAECQRVHERLKGGM